jgi:hypothetical protein
MAIGNYIVTWVYRKMKDHVAQVFRPSGLPCLYNLPGASAMATVWLFIYSHKQSLNSLKPDSKNFIKTLPKGIPSLIANFEAKTLKHGQVILLPVWKLSINYKQP